MLLATDVQPSFRELQEPGVARAAHFQMPRYGEFDKIIFNWLPRTRKSPTKKRLRACHTAVIGASESFSPRFNEEQVVEKAGAIGEPLWPTRWQHHRDGQPGLPTRNR